MGTQRLMEIPINHGLWAARKPKIVDVMNINITEIPVSYQFVNELMLAIISPTTIERKK